MARGVLQWGADTAAGHQSTASGHGGGEFVPARVSNRDNNSGYPNWPSTALYEVTFTPADVHERFTFDSGSTANGCSWESPNATYYDYTAVLPTPFPVTAGTRYWLLVLADTRNTGIGWGWRVGRQDNNHSANMVQSLQIGPFDLAFSLSDQ